ncbi:hypothetical protein PGT21_010208 [Puccinia graminis f. sp. tritici]|uniref:MYND-type domain-containing protein n=1 Tax=Puccinia graminis f. sp. tritici TaxID=56615 RepID=A0A5B0QAF5_PUCGR|nr:hypothetical protein PGT21_010208 [Puccinia graminis f. sp. tritici]
MLVGSVPALRGKSFPTQKSAEEPRKAPGFRLPRVSDPAARRCMTSEAFESRGGGYHRYPPCQRLQQTSGDRERPARHGLEQPHSLSSLFINMEFLNQIDRSTVALTILSFISLLVIYLQHKKILLSPYSNLKLKTSTEPSSSTSSSNPPSSTEDKSARCRECSKLKLISELKICSKCKIPPTQNSNTNDLNFYYCDQKCQRANWKTHKLICGNFKDLQPTSSDPYAALNPLNSPPTDLLSNAHFEKKRAEIEGLLKKWCEFHKNVLIFAAIHGLDLIRSPHNSKLILLMISLTLNEENQSEKFTEITDDEDQDTAIKNSDVSQGPIHSKFTVAHVGSLDSANFFNANVGMSNAMKEIENVRTRVKEKGGLGVATLLIRCGPIVQVFPVGLPSQSDLDAVPRQTNWRAIFDEAIKSGIPWKPRS